MECKSALQVLEGIAVESLQRLSIQQNVSAGCADTAETKTHFNAVEQLAGREERNLHWHRHHLLLCNTTAQRCGTASQCHHLTRSETTSHAFKNEGLQTMQLGILR